MSQEVLDGEDWAYFCFVPDAGNSQRYQPDMRYPVRLTVPTTYMNSYGDLADTEEDHRFSIEAAEKLRDELDDAIRLSKLNALAGS